MEGRIGNFAESIGDRFEGPYMDRAEVDSVVKRDLKRALFAGAIVGAYIAIEGGPQEMSATRDWVDAYVFGGGLTYAISVAEGVAGGVVLGLVDSVKSSTSGLVASAKAIPYSVAGALVCAATKMFVGVPTGCAGAVGGVLGYATVEAASRLF